MGEPERPRIKQTCWTCTCMQRVASVSNTPANVSVMSKTLDLPATGEEPCVVSQKGLKAQRMHRTCAHACRVLWMAREGLHTCHNMSGSPKMTLGTTLMPIAHMHALTEQLNWRNNGCNKSRRSQQNPKEAECDESTYQCGLGHLQTLEHLACTSVCWNSLFLSFYLIRTHRAFLT